jgi:tripartite-type tricarboxylate transporter receptor subunit TctC
MVHVPYKGAALALSDVIGGHVDSMLISAPAAMGHIKSGKVRVLAVASARRAEALPDTPTFAEAGYPEVGVDTRYGLLATGGTPGAVIARLNAAIAKAVASAEVRERYAALSLDPVSTAPKEYADYLRAEITRWRKVVQAAKLPPQ